MSERDDLEGGRLVLSDLLNRVLDKGVVINGHVTISIADIDLLEVDLRLLLPSVEMAVLLAARAPDVEEDAERPGGPGRRYLERQRDLPSHLAGAANAIDDRLRQIALASSRRVDSQRVGLSHLIRRADVDRYRSIAVASISEPFRLVVDGPRAPYSFAAFSPSVTGLS